MIIFNFDVLAKPGKELGARAPEPDGIRLWNMFHEHSLGRLALVVDQDVDRDIFEHWLKVNNIKAAMYEVLDVVAPDLKAEKIQRLAMLTGRSDFYIDRDPLVASQCLRLGIPTLLVLNPYVVLPEWSGQSNSRNWDSLVKEIDRQAIMKAEKTWGDMQ